MKAVGYLKSLAIAEPESLIDFAADAPQPGGRDLRVAVKAVSVNPVDTKVRLRAAPKLGEPPKILGFDAAGVVDAVGAEVTLFKPGDEVFYAGSIARSGSNAEMHLVDERIVGRKPASLSFAKAAALEQQFPDCGGGWQIYWRQSMPGPGNAAHLKNWWPFLFY